MTPASENPYVGVLYRPLLRPAEFFSRLEDRVREVPLARTLLVAGAVFGAVSLLITGQASAVDLPLSSAVPEPAVRAIVFAVSTFLAGFGVLLFSFLPALWLHLLLLVFHRGYQQNMLVSWQIVGFMTVAMIAFSLGILIAGALPEAGGPLSAFANTALSLLAVRALYLAIRAVHRSGRLTAAAASGLAVAPLLAGSVVSLVNV